MNVDCISCQIYSKCIAHTINLEKLEYFQANVVKKTIKKNQFVFREGSNASKFYMLVNGNVKLIKEADLTNPITLRITYSGEMIGLKAILNNNKYYMSALCINDSTFCVFSKTYLLEDNQILNPTCQFLLKELILNTTQILNYSIIMISGNSTSKVAMAILLLLEKNVQAAILKEDIAMMTGLCRETVSRTMSELKRKKIIRVDQKRISLINKDELILLTKKTRRT